MKKITLFILCLVFAVAGISQNTMPVNNPTGYAGEMNVTDANKLKQGFWEETIGRNKYYGEYVDDKKIGTWVSYHHTKGIVYKVEEYKEGKLDGLVIEIDQRGYFTGESHYKNGHLHGKYKKFNRGATLIEETDYYEGQLNGVKKTFYSNKPGKVLEEAYYKMGIKDGPSRWFGVNGNLIAEYIYKDGKFDGINKTYHESGTLMIEEKYKNDEPIGEYMEYWENGTIKMRGSYENGLKEGKWYSYDEAGKEIDVEKYRKGEKK